MAKKKKRKTTNLLILTLVAILCIGAYVLVHMHMSSVEDSESSEEEETVTLLSADTDTAVKLFYQSGDNVVTLIKEDGEWKDSSDKDCPIDQSIVTDMLSVFASTDASKTISDSDETLSEYGLDEPVLTAAVTLEDGTEISYDVGMEAIGDSTGYYVKVSSLDGVYIAPVTVYSQFDYTGNELVAMEDTPEIESDMIYNISIKKGNTEIFAASKDIEEDSSNYDNWEITVPYTSAVAADTNTMSTLASYYATYSFAQNADYNPSDLGKYGLDTPKYTVDLEYLEEQEAESTDSSEEDTEEESTETITVKHTFTLYVGSQDADGYYYVMYDGSDSVYLMSESSVNTLIAVNAFNYVYTAIYDTDFSGMQTLMFKADGETYKLTVEKDEDSSEEESEDEATYECTMNGDAMDEADAQSLYSLITALTYKAEITSEVSYAKTVLSIELTSDNAEKATTSIEFKTYDSNYYQVVVDGEAHFVTDKRDVDEIVTQLKEK